MSHLPSQGQGRVKGGHAGWLPEGSLKTCAVAGHGTMAEFPAQQFSFRNFTQALSSPDCNPHCMLIQDQPERTVDTDAKSTALPIMVRATSFTIGTGANKLDSRDRPKGITIRSLNNGQYRKPCPWVPIHTFPCLWAAALLAEEIGQHRRKPQCWLKHQ